MYVWYWKFGYSCNQRSKRWLKIAANGSISVVPMFTTLMLGSLSGGLLIRGSFISVGIRVCFTVITITLFLLKYSDIVMILFTSHRDKQKLLSLQVVIVHRFYWGICVYYTNHVLQSYSFDWLCIMYMFLHCKMTVQLHLLDGSIWMT